MRYQVVSMEMRWDDRHEFQRPATVPATGVSSFAYCRRSGQSRAKVWKLKTNKKIHVEIVVNAHQFR